MLTHLRWATAVGFLLAATVAWAANKAPTVSITSPANGATFTAPATVTVNATASDSDGTVTKVEFYQGTTLLGTRTAAPYTMSLMNVAGGTYSLTAKATDNAGATKTSTAVSITVTGPKVLISSPPAGAMVYASSITVTGSFFGDANTTVLVDNGATTRLATLSGNSFTATLPIYLGANTVRVVATRRDKTTDQVSIGITGNQAPLLVFTAPPSTVFDAPATIPFTVDAVSPAGAISKVDFLRNGAVVGTSTAPPYQYTWSNASAGSYSISARATDISGTTATISLPITVNGPNALPTVSLTSPTNGASFMAPANMTLAATASDADGSITLVEFLRNGNVIGTTNVAPYTMTWSGVASGAYSLTARATDNRSGVATSAPVNITITALNNPPAVALTSPASGTTYTAPATVGLAANASDSDGSVAKVDFYQGATLIGTANSATYAVAWANVAAGTFSLTAKATDNLGAVTTSAPVSITVSPNSPPSVSMSAPAAGTSYHSPAAITLAAAASDTDGTISQVEFFQNGVSVASVTSAPYTFSWNNVPAGSYTLTATATDNAGATTTSAPIVVTVNALTVSIISPSDGAAIADDSITVSGVISAPQNSGLTVNGVVAAIDSTGHFYANSVPLAVGSNAISAILTTLDGQQTTTIVNVSSTGAAPVRIVASPTEGLSPLAVQITVSVQPGTNLERVGVDWDSDGNIDEGLLAPTWSTTVTYTASIGSTVNATVRAYDDQGNVFTQVFPIVIQDRAQLDQNLRSLWSGMVTALAAGDKTSALKYLSPRAQTVYGPVFDALLPDLATITSS